MARLRHKKGFQEGPLYKHNNTGHVHELRFYEILTTYKKNEFSVRFASLKDDEKNKTDFWVRWLKTGEEFRVQLKTRSMSDEEKFDLLYRRIIPIYLEHNLLTEAAGDPNIISNEEAAKGVSRRFEAQFVTYAEMLHELRKQRQNVTEGDLKKAKEKIKQLFEEIIKDENYEVRASFPKGFVFEPGTA